MIPYDDLVVALQTWRARQGLPVAQLSGMMVPPPSPISSQLEPPRTNPPAPPPARAAVPPPLAPVDTRDEDVEEAALIEEGHYANEGDDFEMAFGNAVNESAEPAESDESTSIGTPPPPVNVHRDSFGGSTEPEPPPGKHDRDDW